MFGLLQWTSLRPLIYPVHKLRHLYSIGSFVFYSMRSRIVITAGFTGLRNGMFGFPGVASSRQQAVWFEAENIIRVTARTATTTILPLGNLSQRGLLEGERDGQDNHHGYL
jgi:hypothetical protein